MKLFKRIIVSLLVVLILLPILFYGSIVVTNNYIANRIEKNLTSYELPEDTKLIDSFSKAEKLSGNGNGMQYVGVILVESELSTGAIKEHYSQKFDFIEVNEQKNEEIRFDLKTDRTFKGKIKDNGKTYYSVICWDDNRHDIFGEFISVLLDFDLRGH